MGFIDEDARSFLQAHGLNESDVFDARGKAKAVWRVEAKRLGKPLIYGTPCAAAGHRLRTRSGHCVQCKPAMIAYQRRHSARQTLYIAGSQTLGCLKIGVTADIFDRHTQMNTQAYGGANDWQVLFRLDVDHAGRVEAALFRMFASKAVKGETWKDGRWQETREMLKVSLSEAYTATAEIIQREGLDIDRKSAMKTGDWSKY
jgi:hypothetical protein